MKLTLLLLLAVDCCIAGTPRENPPLKVHMALVQTFEQIQLTWEPNYDTWPSNAVTVIIASPNLSIDRKEWAEVFRGATNQCVLPMTSPQEFFAAYNTTNNI